jgi:hypothetical protein
MLSGMRDLTYPPIILPAKTAFQLPTRLNRTRLGSQPTLLGATGRCPLTQGWIRMPQAGASCRKWGIRSLPHDRLTGIRTTSDMGTPDSLCHVTVTNLGGAFAVGAALVDLLVTMRCITPLTE